MDQNTSATSSNWTSTQVYVLAVICLVVGVALGYLLRGSERPKTPLPEAASSAAPSGMGSMGGQQMPSPDQMRKMVEKQGEPLFAKLKSNPTDASVLAEIGNLYYDAQLYPDAIGYYDKSLKSNPGNASVRTDMGTAYYYTGDPDRALAEFQEALKSNPKHSQARYNMGMVLWQGKGDVNGAVAAWEYLLKSDPNYPEREKVQTLIDKAKEHMKMVPGAPGTKTNKPTKM